MSLTLHDQFDIYRVNAFSPLSDFTAAYNEAVAKGWQYAENDLLEHFAITDEAAMRVSHVRHSTSFKERR